jgi:hypothetical protein
MKHADAATFQRIATLLDALRKRPELREPRPGTFYLKSRAFLHFHDDPAGIFADVKLDGHEFSRLAVTTQAQQRALLKHIDGCLGQSTPRPR